MGKEQLITLIKIYNTLTTISTKGEDTLTMADCLRAFRTTIFELSDFINNITEIPINNVLIQNNIDEDIKE